MAGYAGLQQQEPSPPKHPANELALAGLRPGKDTLGVAEGRYKGKHRLRATSAGDGPEWLDACNKRSLKLELDKKGVIQVVTVSELGMGELKTDCSNRAYFPGAKEQWRTARGLKLGDPRDRIIELYGEPDSGGPSTKEGRELELLFYAFDWVGSDVPQVMQVFCDRETGRVVEITLAFPSL